MRPFPWDSIQSGITFRRLAARGDFKDPLFSFAGVRDIAGRSSLSLKHGPKKAGRSWLSSGVDVLSAADRAFRLHLYLRRAVRSRRSAVVSLLWRGKGAQFLPVERNARSTCPFSYQA